MSDQSDLNGDNPIGKKSLQSQQGFFADPLLFHSRNYFSKKNHQDLILILFLVVDLRPISLLANHLGLSSKNTAIAQCSHSCI